MIFFLIRIYYRIVILFYKLMRAFYRGRLNALKDENERLKKEKKDG